MLKGAYVISTLYSLSTDTALESQILSMIIMSQRLIQTLTLASSHCKK